MTTTMDAVSQGLAYLAGSKAGAINERARIIAELEQGKRALVFGPDKALVDNIIKLINKGETK